MNGNGNQNQFEFIDGKPVSNRPTSASDNLLLAPSAGGHSNHNIGSAYGGTVQELVPSAYADRPSTTGAGGADLFLQQANNRYNPGLARPSADLIDQRSSAPDAFPSNFAGGQPIRSTSGGLTGYFERLSSIELLFLISSLMFLVLLGLGLAGGYFCFRRQAAHERQASAILRRKRRFVGNLGMLSPHSSSSAGLLHLPASLRAQPNNHHYYHQQRQHHQHHHGPPPPPAPPTTSSPESDLSGRRGLLATTNHLSRDEQHGRPTYMFNNQAFVPDPAMLSAHRYGRDKPVIGRRGDPKGIFGRGGAGPVSSRQAAAMLHNHHHNHRAPTPYSMNDISASANKYGRSQQGLYRARPIYVDHNEDEPRELSRAKSLTCVPGGRLAESVGGRRRGQLEQPIIGGTLSRHPRHQQQPLQRDHHQQQQQHRHRNHYLPSLGTGKHRMRSIRDSSKENNNNSKHGDAWLQVSSDSEVEPNNNNNNTNSKYRDSTDRANFYKGKLFLKSIEDSYITKFTEIEEKEYTKRDSLRPLGLAEWREKIAEQKERRKRDQQADEVDDDDSSYKSSSSSSAAGENEAQPPGPVLKSSSVVISPDGQQQEQEYVSASTNLRSLTELDVNFAKSLLRVAPPTKKEEPESARQTSDKKSATTNKQEQEEEEEEEPDLIVSTEYDLHRLELTEEPTGASRNSVSYV